ncbi:hypothetical protein EMPS_07969 [Entomortierella parvispora]|uniref:Uncharacterized protein n=1 Tax=Entomortierella parvispora TaxID=205924 RepID=A0A9P3LYM5_9FUNG|nr:hypothetical protein EMPS_07969 [Entomortierella parvispora]
MSTSPEGTSLLHLSLGHGLAAMVHVHLCHRSYLFTRGYCSEFNTSYDRTQRLLLRHSLGNLSHFSDLITEITPLLRRLNDRSQQRLQQSRRLSGLARARRRSSSSYNNSRSSMDEWSSEEEHDLPTLNAHTIETAELERIRNLYKSSRAGRESIKTTAITFLTSIDRTFLDMHYNVITSTILGSLVAVRYFVSTNSFARYGSWIFTYGRWIGNKISSFLLPRSSLVPWGLAPNSSTNPTPSPPSGSFIPTLLFPLAPTICLATMHFSMACISRWAITGMQSDMFRQLRMAARATTILELLSYREKRLDWLITEMRAYERVKNDMDAYESDESSSSMSSSEYRTYASSLQSWQVQSPPPATVRHPLYKSITKRRQRADFKLEDLDMIQFLSDPIERDRILQMELQAIVDEQRTYLEALDLPVKAPPRKS